MMAQVQESDGRVLAGRLHRFALMLRDNGVRCGLVEVMDAFRALDTLGDEAMASRDVFKAALRATLVKGHADGTTFERVFELYFGGGVELERKLAQSLHDQLMERMHGEGEVNALLQILGDMDGQLQQLTRALLGAQTAQLSHMIQQAMMEMDISGMQSRLQVSYFAQRLMSRLGMRALETDLDAIRQRLSEQFDDATVQRAMAALEERTQGLRAGTRQALEAQLEMRNVQDKAREQNLLDKSFQRLSPEEVERMKQVVRALAERLKSVVRRHRIERKGFLDVRKTLRANMGLGGVPANVRFRRKQKDRPQLAVLCDVSDSVRHASMFMLQLVYTLQELFTRVRSFVFVSDLGEVTDVFKEHSVDEAVDLSMAGKAINLYANSNFGRAFLLFHREHLDALTRNTTVIILGDGRNNYNPSNAFLLQEWRRRARKLIWLCTEDRGTWGFGDSEMPAYARACDSVEVVQNLRQLRKAVDGLLR